jgi:hypothetical protein
MSWHKRILLDGQGYEYDLRGVLRETEEWQHYRKVTRPCSCSMCGNPRRHWGQLTVQERRQKAAGE